MSTRPLHVLVNSLTFPPDSVSTAQIVGQLVADLRAAGCHVTVLTTTPHYNSAADTPETAKLRSWAGRLVQRSDHHGADVYHAAIPPKTASAAARIVAWLVFNALSVAVGLFVRRPVDVIFAVSPPLTNGAVAWLLGLVHGAPYVYNVQELYPDIMVKLRALKEGSWFHRLLLGLEAFVYRKARIVTVISHGMERRLLDKGVPPGKVQVIPNFVDVTDLTPAPKDNPFSRQHGIDRIFTVTYAGNLGPAQGLDVVLDAAALLRAEPDVRFLIVGDGIIRESLRQRIESEGLHNCTQLDYQPYALMLQLYAASDISLVPQAAETGFDAIPSKVYRIMACGRAVVALTDPGSDLARLLGDSGAGCVASPRDPASLAEIVRTAARNPAPFRDMGTAGRAHVLECYERQAVTSRYLALFGQLSGDKRAPT